MKKCTVMFLLAVLLLSLIGCSGGGFQEPDELPPFTWNDNGKADLLGYEFVYNYWRSASSTYGSDSLFWYNPGTLYYDMVIDRFDKIQKDLNCKVTFAKTEREDPVIEMIILGASMGNGYDLVSSNWFGGIGNMIHAGALYPLDEFDGIINYRDESVYGPINIMETALVDGKIYMVTPYTHPERQLLTDFLTVFNQTMTERNDVTDPRELHEQKQWTWAGFEKFLDDNTVFEDGKTKIYGYASSDNMFAYYALPQNGVQLAVRDGSNWKSGYSSEAAVQTIQWVQKMLTQYRKHIRAVSKNAEAMDLLVNETAYVGYTEIGFVLGNAQYELDKFGVLPFPYGPSCEYGKGAIDCVMYGNGVCTSSNEPEGAALVLNAFCQPFDEYPTSADALKIYENIFFDSRDIDTIYQLVQCSRSSYYPYIGTTFASAITSNLSSMSAMQIIDSVSDELETIIQENVVPNMDFIEANFKK